MRICLEESASRLDMGGKVFRGTVFDQGAKPVIVRAKETRNLYLNQQARDLLMSLQPTGMSIDIAGEWVT